MIVFVYFIGSTAVVNTILRVRQNVRIEMTAYSRHSESESESEIESESESESESEIARKFVCISPCVFLNKKNQFTKFS
jgi:hypothetical protein